MDCNFFGHFELFGSKEIFGDVVNVEVFAAKFEKELGEENCLTDVPGEDGADPFSVCKHTDGVFIPSFVANVCHVDRRQWFA